MSGSEYQFEDINTQVAYLTHCELDASLLYDKLIRLYKSRQDKGEEKLEEIINYFTKRKRDTIALLQNQLSPPLLTSEDLHMVVIEWKDRIERLKFAIQLNEYLITAEDHLKTSDPNLKALKELLNASRPLNDLQRACKKWDKLINVITKSENSQILRDNLKEFDFDQHIEFIKNACVKLGGAYLRYRKKIVSELLIEKKLGIPVDKINNKCSAIIEKLVAKLNLLSLLEVATGLYQELNQLEPKSPACKQYETDLLLLQAQVNSVIEDPAAITTSDKILELSTRLNTYVLSLQKCKKIHDSKLEISEEKLDVTPVPVLRTFGKELESCGKNWGRHVDLSGSGVIQRYTGNKSWIETAVLGVVGMHGNEAGKGPGIVIKDVGNSNIDMIWTNELRGCMGLAIIGKDEHGKLDAFFGHARQYDKSGATQDKENPMSLAREFVSTHADIRVFWGTDFAFMESGRDKASHITSKIADAQKLLSKELGCWVRISDCTMSDSLCFFPNLGIMAVSSPIKAYESVQAEDWVTRSAYSASKQLSKFEPAAEILKNLEIHLEKIKADKESPMRLYFYDDRRANKIKVLEEVIEAYKVGNFDVLRYYNSFAITGSESKSKDTTWSAINESETARLVMSAYQDALLKIRAMGKDGCGLSDYGVDVSYKDYQKSGKAPATLKK